MLWEWPKEIYYSLGCSPNCEVGPQSDERPESMSISVFVFVFWIRESHMLQNIGTRLSNAE